MTSISGLQRGHKKVSTYMFKAANSPLSSSLVVSTEISWERRAQPPKCWPWLAIYFMAKGYTTQLQAASKKESSKFPASELGRTQMLYRVRIFQSPASASPFHLTRRIRWSTSIFEPYLSSVSRTPTAKPTEEGQPGSPQD